MFVCFGFSPYPPPPFPSPILHTYTHSLGEAIKINLTFLIFLSVEKLYSPEPAETEKSHKFNSPSTLVCVCVWEQEVKGRPGKKVKKCLNNCRKIENVMIRALISKVPFH